MRLQLSCRPLQLQCLRLRLQDHYVCDDLYDVTLQWKAAAAKQLPPPAAGSADQPECH